MFLLDSCKTKYSNIKTSKGFTLIETLIVIFILALLIPSLFNSIGWNMKVSWNGVETQKSQEQFRIFNTFLIEDLQYSSNIEIINEVDFDQLSYVTPNKNIEIYRFEADGLYKILNDEKQFIAQGKPYETNLPPVFLEKNGFIRFNFYSKDINSLLYLSIKPRVFRTP